LKISAVCGIIIPDKILKDFYIIEAKNTITEKENNK